LRRFAPQRLIFHWEGSSNTKAQNGVAILCF